MRWADVRNNYRSVEELHKSNRDFVLRIESELMLVAERAAEDASWHSPQEPAVARAFLRSQSCSSEWNAPSQRRFARVAVPLARPWAYCAAYRILMKPLGAR